jgi:hypothetical protein
MLKTWTLPIYCCYSFRLLVWLNCVQFCNSLCGRDDASVDESCSRFKGLPRFVENPEIRHPDHQFAPLNPTLGILTFRILSGENATFRRHIPPPHWRCGLCVSPKLRNLLKPGRPYTSPLFLSSLRRYFHSPLRLLLWNSLTPWEFPIKILRPAYLLIILGLIALILLSETYTLYSCSLPVVSGSLLLHFS